MKSAYKYIYILNIGIIIYFEPKVIYIPLYSKKILNRLKINISAAIANLKLKDIFFKEKHFCIDYLLL